MNWIIAANNKVYDHYKSFSENGYIDWHQVANFSIGDTVYVYCTAPIKMIRYKTVVTAVNLSFENITDDKKYWKNLEMYEDSKKDSYCRLVLIEEIYNEYLSLEYLNKNGIKGNVQGPRKINTQLQQYIDDVIGETHNILLTTSNEEFAEGTKKLKQHIVRERNKQLIELAKNRFKSTHDGNLFCEICGFDFYKTYGSLGNGFIEVHHTKPISKMKEGEKTKISDMAVVCSNCHSMIHRKKEFITVDSLKKLIERNNKKRKIK